MNSTIYMERTFNVDIDDGLFIGLANQNMLFHDCLCELIDNSIASKQPDSPFRVDIIFTKKTDTPNYYLYIVDNSLGMSAKTLENAMQPGRSASTKDRLHEHGFGLKHSLATLTKHTRFWKIWSKDLNTDRIASVQSPFGKKMKMDDDTNFPTLPYIVRDVSTVIQAEITFDYIQTVQGRGAPAQSLEKLLEWVREHLGVIYRGYLTTNAENDYEVDGQIFVSLDTDKKKVIPIEIPIEGNEDDKFQMEVEGKLYWLKFTKGLINEEKVNNFFGDKKGLKAYYQNSTKTQGIDIRIGKRVIATKQFESIYGLTPHPQYNAFVGELVIPELPRNVLRTVNNKTNVDYDDNNWQKIFTHLKVNHPVSENPRYSTEKKLTEKWKNKLLESEERDIVNSHFPTAFAGVEIDVIREKFDTKEITIYELKIGKAKPIDLYQLKMYWDGLTLTHKDKNPSNGILICDEYADTLKEMVRKMNSMPPLSGSYPYNFTLKTLNEVGLLLNEVAIKSKKKHEPVKLNMTYEEAMKKALNTPLPKNKRGAKKGTAKKDT